MIDLRHVRHLLAVASYVAACPLAGSPTAPRFEQWKAKQGHRDLGRAFVPSLVCDNYEVLVQLAERTGAIVFGPRPLFSPAGERLFELFIDHGTPGQRR